MEYITVQRLSSHVEERYQKYARIEPSARIPLSWKPTIQNIKEACKCYLNVENGSKGQFIWGEPARVPELAHSERNLVFANISY